MGTRWVLKGKCQLRVKVVYIGYKQIQLYFIVLYLYFQNHKLVCIATQIFYGNLMLIVRFHLKITSFTYEHKILLINKYLCNIIIKRETK